MFTKIQSTIFVVISLLVVVLVFSSTADVLAKPKISTPYTCRYGGPGKVQCCADVPAPATNGAYTITYCTVCDNTSPPSNCSDRYCVNNCSYANTLSPSGNKIGQLPLAPNGNLAFSPSNTTNNTTPSSGLLNGRIPTTNTFNAPITTAGGNTSNPSNNNTTTGGSLNTIRGPSSATRSLINGNSPPASGPQPQLPYPTTINSTSAAMKATRGLYSPTGGCIPGGSTCVPCDIGLARIGANCIPSGDWHPTTNGLPPSSTLQQQQPTTLCPDGSQPDANGNCPTTSTTNNQQISPPATPTHHHKGSNNLLGGLESTTTTKKSKINGNNNSSSVP